MILIVLAKASIRLSASHQVQGLCPPLYDKEVH